MDSDTNSNTTVYNTIFQFKNSDLETPDEFDNSEPSPSTFSQPPFQLLYSQIRFEPPSSPSSVSNVTPTYFSLTSEPSDKNSSVNTQISHELDNFITLQQQLQHRQTLTFTNSHNPEYHQTHQPQLPLQITTLRQTQLPRQIHPHLVQPSLSKKENPQYLISLSARNSQNIC